MEDYIISDAVHTGKDAQFDTYDVESSDSEFLDNDLKDFDI